MKESPAAVYQQKLQEYTAVLSSHKKKRSNLGWLRLIAVVVMAVIIYYGFSNGWVTGLMLLTTGVALFLFLVSLDLKNDEKIFYFEKLILINTDELNTLAGQYTYREDGLSFLPHEHAYAADLDLFGASSIYQYINRCTSDQAKSLLASSLLAGATAEVVIERQQAAEELKDKLPWRQQLQFIGIANPITLGTEEKIFTWLQSGTPYQQKHWTVLAQVFPVITLASAVAYLAGFLPSAAFTLLVFCFYFISLLISRKVSRTYERLSRIVKEVNTLHQVFQHVEGLSCKSSLLARLQDLAQANGKASNHILQLKKILDRFDMRLNIYVFIFLNTFLLWDLRQVLALNKWRNKNAHAVKNWFDIIAAIEFLSTISTIAYNHPNWCLPAIGSLHFTLLADEVGHPLIKEDKRVDNSFTTEGTAKVSIITGSNMAGKSTFLRSIGVNLVLAQMGARVCAKSFVFSPVALCTSMRVADNLAENTSTFYAELKKLKSIIEKVNAGEEVFILLDEILRGTNSLDKHTGSEALIKQFIRRNAVAIIATHDVELGNLKNEYGNHIENYHFDVQVEGEELYFDYKIKRGICQSLNASLLMKKIGIELDRGLH
jgi:hypothetical protein